MRLKRLQLQGYKTFASKTEFIFDDGITAIVGPNGSGKSNVADALRWVLGEQSFSALRGKRGTDMIFTGSQSRSRAGMAQAVLTLDNSDGWLPIDYSEVEIGRRTYRSGDTEYLLNGQKVRLMDITDLLATSGLAERTYTIIGQGLIDRALSLRAEERRALFEEAAGISHYQSRRAETLRRLQETQRNLQRVHDILSEIQPRLTSLKRQASRAQNYEQIAADLRQLLRIWYGYQWDKAKRDLRDLRLAAATAQTNWEKSRQALLQQQGVIGQQRRRINQIQHQVREEGMKRDSLREEQEAARRQVAVLQERQKLLARQLAELDQELPHLRDQQLVASKALDESLADLERAQQNLASEQGSFQQFSASYQAQQVQIEQWQQKLTGFERERRETQNQLAQHEGQVGQLRERLQEKQQGDSLADQLVQAKTRLAELGESVVQAEAAVKALREQRKQSQEERQALLRELKGMRRESQAVIQRLNRDENGIARLEARCDMLDQMRQKETRVAADLPLIGRLASLVTIPAEYQIAIEAALGVHLSTLVVPDEDTLWRLVGENHGRQSLSAIATAAINGESAKGPEMITHPVLGRASELVDCPADWRPLVALLLGRVWLVEDARTAYQVAQQLEPGGLAVSLDGLVAYASGVIETSSGDRQASILAREEAWREVAAELEANRAALEERRAAAGAQQVRIQKQQEQVDRLSDEERRLYQKEQEAAQELATAQRTLDRAQQQAEFIRAQQADNARQIALLTERITRVEQAIEAGREQVVRLEARHDEARVRLQALPVAELQQERQSRQQKVDAAQTIVAGRQAVVDSRRATLNQIEEQLRRRQLRRQALCEQQEEMNLGEAEATLRALQTQIDQIDAALRPLQEQLIEGQQQLEEAEEALEAEQRRAHDLENLYTGARVKLSQHESHIEGLSERIKGDLGLVALDYDDDQTGPTPLPLQEIVDQLPEVPELPDDIEASIHRYRGQLQRMGAVNPDAPAEYEETQQRYDFLSQQVEDLNKTETQLRKVIDELDHLTSQAFAETVERVDGIFSHMFTRLFGGGSAQLVLTEPDDLTVSGVDIIARLPSRRQQGLGLLSGGERSLTAAALIFALLKVSPPPFCVMDEVDAMLDEANVNRFRDALRELSNDTQFIVITHNRGTVQAARTVYGISMGNDSASQVLSVRPEDYVNGEES